MLLHIITLQFITEINLPQYQTLNRQHWYNQNMHWIIQTISMYQFIVPRRYACSFTSKFQTQVYPGMPEVVFDDKSTLVKVKACCLTYMLVKTFYMYVLHVGLSKPSTCTGNPASILNQKMDKYPASVLNHIKLTDIILKWKLKLYILCWKLS